VTGDLAKAKSLTFYELNSETVPSQLEPTDFQYSACKPLLPASEYNIAALSKCLFFEILIPAKFQQQTMKNVNHNSSLMLILYHSIRKHLQRTHT